MTESQAIKAREYYYLGSQSFLPHQYSPSISHTKYKKCLRDSEKADQCLEIMLPPLSCFLRYRDLQRRNDGKGITYVFGRQQEKLEKIKIECKEPSETHWCVEVSSIGEIIRIAKR